MYSRSFSGRLVFTVLLVTRCRSPCNSGTGLKYLRPRLLVLDSQLSRRERERTGTSWDWVCVIGIAKQLDISSFRRQSSENSGVLALSCDWTRRIRDLSGLNEYSPKRAVVRRLKCKTGHSLNYLIKLAVCVKIHVLSRVLCEVPRQPWTKILSSGATYTMNFWNISKHNLYVSILRVINSS